MNYEEEDFVETADHETLELIVHAREHFFDSTCLLFVNAAV